MTRSEIRDLFDNLLSYYGQCWPNTETSRRAARDIVRALEEHPWLLDQIPDSVLRMARREASVSASAYPVTR